MKIRGTSASRMEQNYAEALALMGDLKTVYAKAAVVAGGLIDNLAMRLEWSAKENERRARAATGKGEPPPAPVTTVAELESLSRIVTVLYDPRMNDSQPGDADAGAREIVRILELARKDFSNVKAENPKGAGVKEAPEEKERLGIQAGDEIRQTPTIERPPEPRHRILGHGKVRRTSG